MIARQKYSFATVKYINIPTLYCYKSYTFFKYRVEKIRVPFLFIFHSVCGLKKSICEGNAYPCVIYLCEFNETAAFRIFLDFLYMVIDSTLNPNDGSIMFIYEQYSIGLKYVIMRYFLFFFSKRCYY